MEHDRIRFGERLAVSFHRTLRVPDDGHAYPLPAGLGRFPIVAWRRGQEVVRHLIPMHRREAVWIGFSGAAWKPNAVKVLAGGINAVSGRPDAGRGLGAPQDYLVCPLQPWLDGFNAGDGTIRQFVAMPLGGGYGVEVGHGLPETGGLSIVAFEPKPGVFPDAPPPAPPGPQRFAARRASAVHELALGAGGRIGQKFYPDPHGREAWEVASHGRASVTLVDSGWFAELTGTPPPPTPIDAATYRAAGLPWFALYDEDAASLRPVGGSPPRTIGDRDRERGEPEQDAPVAIERTSIKTLRERGVTKLTDDTTREG